MANSTIVRVKRTLEETPHEALLLQCKRVKTEERISPSVFVFTGTVDKQENTDSHIKKVWSKNNETHQKTTTKTSTEILEKVRQKHKSKISENRLEIINCNRGLQADDSFYDLLDVESKVKTPDSDDVMYAYDIYLAQTKDFDVSMLDNIVRIDPLEGDLIYGSYRDNGRVTPSTEGDTDEDDSNDENNWRNDYPDSDSSIKESDMKLCMENFHLDDDLSSDDGEEDLVYNNSKNTTSKTNTNAEVSPKDVERYGLAYAKYKARLVAGETSLMDKSNLVYCELAKDTDNDSVEGYKDDSDDGFYYGDDDHENNASRYSRNDSSDLDS